MKTRLMIVAAALVLAACGTKGPVLDAVKDADSVRVVEAYEDGSPMTVCYHKGKEQTWLQYYSTGVKRSEGMVVDGRREGRWVFYHPDGSVQVESTFLGGVEEGPYKVYRESGIPYYMGQYKHGERTGRWEIYNDDGTLAAEKEY